MPQPGLPGAHSTQVDTKNGVGSVVVRIIRGPEAGNVLCAAQHHGEDIWVYLPADEISGPAAQALTDVLNEKLHPRLPSQRLPT